MKNNQEVEVRALLTPSQRSHLMRRLRKEARFTSREILIDTYLCPISVKSFKEIEMDKVGSYSLRLRKSTLGKKNLVELNTKTITRHGDHNAWEEHEVTLDSFEEALRILHTLGFKSYFTLQKTRYTFHAKPFTILIEDVKDFDSLIEVEIMTSSHGVDSAKEKIYTFLEDFGIKKEQTVRKSVTNLLMRARASF